MLDKIPPENVSTGACAALVPVTFFHYTHKKDECLINTSQTCFYGVFKDSPAAVFTKQYDSKI